VVGTDVTYPRVEEELGNIGCWGTVCAAGSEVFDDVFAVAAEGSKVVAVASWGESEDAVKLFD